ncbi:MAG: LysM peptidoglycan-binding domain-containing protein [Peptoclostridium sp.]|uniref:LysM peptidoglycan-binding domain-containing protein n=1 Tax=Peptoclostridium sp. TaxID=1904860 RepID=UPI00139CA23F|nr:LysM peptidoglycan-binding domain-containing protein [Peptoclostridium sp.]MZQ75637.1 LysM peptidoglycan-binding domain-containing protein [Peptoclostridium sp.]
MKRMLVYIILLLSLTVNVFNIFAQGKQDIGDIEIRQIVVMEGDTLWDIAQKNMSEDTDIRDYICQIQELNDMDGANLIPGETIMVPLLQ